MLPYAWVWWISILSTKAIYLSVGYHKYASKTREESIFQSIICLKTANLFPSPGFYYPISPGRTSRRWDMWSVFALIALIPTSLFLSLIHRCHFIFDYFNRIRMETTSRSTRFNASFGHLCPSTDSWVLYYGERQTRSVILTFGRNDSFIGNSFFISDQQKCPFPLLRY